MVARRLFLGFLIGIAAGVAVAAGLPYDERADAGADLGRALATAADSRKDVLLVFGANWCPDCRELDKALHGTNREPIERRFVVVKVDVGNFDRNLDLSRRYGNPIEKGIPAAVILSPDGRVVYATLRGELADARRMSESGIVEFLTDKAAAPR